VVFELDEMTIVLSKATIAPFKTTLAVCNTAFWLCKTMMGGSEALVEAIATIAAVCKRGLIASKAVF